MTATGVLDVIQLDDATVRLKPSAEAERIRVHIGDGPPSEAALHLLRAMRREVTVTCKCGATALHVVQTPRAVSGSRRLGAGHTNTIDVVDERYVVKWYAEPAAGMMREQRLLERLAHRGGEISPGMVGALTWQPSDGAPTTLAVVTQFLPGAANGWTLLERLDPFEAEGEVLELASSFGAALGRLHAALSHGARGLLAPRTRLRRIARRVAAAQYTDGSAVPTPVVGAPPQLAGDLPVQDVHGDAHLGQFLVTALGSDVHVIDLEGDPIDSSFEQGRQDTPMRDLAALRRSIVLVHLWRKAEYGDPERSRTVYDLAVESATEAYFAAAGRSSKSMSSWLPLLEVEKAAGEILYAQRFLPSWLPIARSSYRDAVSRTRATAPKSPPPRLAR